MVASAEDAPTVRSPVVGRARLPSLGKGQRVGDYTVGALLAMGGMAAVYEVTHRSLGSVYALKVLDPELYEAEPTSYRDMLEARIRREGRIQSQLDHPNVVRVHQLLEVGGGPGLVMDLVDGPSLEGLVSNRHRLDWDDIDAIGDGLLQGVRAAHAAGVIHRDIKPANILMARVDGAWCPRLTDFGLAKRGGLPLVGEDLTATGQVMGTVGYMAPAQQRDAKHVSPQVDVFATGAVLYELVTGERLADWGEADPVAVEQALHTLATSEGPRRFRDAIRLALAPPGRGVQAATVHRVWRTGRRPWTRHPRCVWLRGARSHSWRRCW